MFKAYCTIHNAAVALLSPVSWVTFLFCKSNSILFSVFVCFLVIVLRIHQLGEDLSGMTGRIKVVCMIASFLLGALFASVSAEDVFVMIEIVVLILIKLRLRHFYCYVFISFFLVEILLR